MLWTVLALNIDGYRRTKGFAWLIYIKKLWGYSQVNTCTWVTDVICCKTLQTQNFTKTASNQDSFSHQLFCFTKQQNLKFLRFYQHPQFYRQCFSISLTTDHQSTLRPTWKQISAGHQALSVKIFGQSL